MTVLEAASFLASHARQAVFAPGEWCQLAIADIRTDVLIGDMGVLISPDRSRAEFGLSITPGVQGTGYGSESTRGLIDLLFSATPVVEVMASTDIRNAACLRVLGRAGMRHVETRQVECKGESCVEHVFSISREGAGRRR